MFKGAIVRPFKNKRIFSEAIFIVLGKGLALIIQIASIRILTNIVSPDLFGRFSVIITFSTLAEMLFGVLGQATARYYFVAKEKGEFKIFRNVSKVFINKITITIGVLFLFLSFFSFSLLNIGLLFLFTFFNCTSSLLSGIQNAERHRHIVVMHEILDKVFRLFFSFLFITYLSHNLNSLLAGYAVSTLIIFVSQLYFYHAKIEKEHSKEPEPNSMVLYNEYKRNVIKYSTPFLIWTIFTWVQVSSDKWIIGILLSSKDVGIYQPLNQYGFQLISIGFGMLNILVMPVIYERAGTGKNPKEIIDAITLNNKITLWMIFPTFLIVILVSIFHSNIYTFLVAKEYREVSYLLPFMMLGGSLFALGQQLSINFTINFKPYIIIAPKIATAIFGILTNFFFIKVLGLKGLVLSICVTQLVYVSWIFLLSRKIKHSLN